MAFQLRLSLLILISLHFNGFLSSQTIIVRVPALLRSSISHQNLKLLKPTADMASSLPCTCICDSPDSPLSTTANVISIVTLIYVVLASVLYQVRVLRNGIRLMYKIGDDMSSVREQIDSLIAWNEQRQDGGNKSLQTVLLGVDRQLRDAENILSQFDGTMYMRRSTQTWQSFKFLRTRAELERRLSTIKGDKVLCRWLASVLSATRACCKY